MKHIKTFESFLNEAATISFSSVADGVTAEFSNVTKRGKDIMADAVMPFKRATDTQAFLDNELDNVNNAILAMAQANGIIDSDEYTVGFDKSKTNGSTITGTFGFYAA